jgi:hypothetical protein
VNVTIEHLDTLCYGIVAAERNEAEARMKQARAFCNGNDETAAYYDGPTGAIARHVNARRVFNELAHAAARAS